MTQPKKVTLKCQHRLPRSRGPVGTVYLLHFDVPYKHARHYIGWASDLTHRLAEHQAGHGARLLEVIQQAGIGWTLARIWTGTRAKERQLKNRGGASRCCPCCGVQPVRQRYWPSRELRHIVRRLFALIDAEWITDTAVITYAAKQLAARIARPHSALTPADLVGWTERTTTMNLLNYTLPYIRKDGSVWCVEEDIETGTENACRLVVDTETGLTLFLPEYLVDVDAEQPRSRRGGQAWPYFRWATSLDLPRHYGGRVQ